MKVGLINNRQQDVMIDLYLHLYDVFSCAPHILAAFVPNHCFLQCERLPSLHYISLLYITFHNITLQHIYNVSVSPPLHYISLY